MMTKTIFKIRNIKWHFLFIYALLVILVVVLNTQCIKEYDPDLDVDVKLLTVNGSIVRGNEEQTVVITRSTPVDDTQYKAVINCEVFVTDDRNNKFQFKEISAGKYIAKIDLSYLEIGAKFKLTIHTPENNVYESGYEEIHDCPPVDSLYFLEESNYSKELNTDLYGIRLNIDLHAREGFTGYYRWKIDETWEYRSRNSWIDKELVGVIPYRGTPIYYNFNKKDSLHRCWKGDEVNELYSASTINLETDGRKSVPLHFIFENDKKIYVRYSCLVSQYSLNEGAYNYWQNKEVELKESGGMYFSQPSQSLSNIKNINYEQETVLGYFWTSSLTRKRIFYEGKYNPITTPPCEFGTLYVKDYYKGPYADGEFYRINSSAFPVYVFDSIFVNYFTNRIDTIPLTTDKSCFDCRLEGGTINKPDYW